MDRDLEVDEGSQQVFLLQDTLLARGFRTHRSLLDQELLTKQQAACLLFAQLASFF